VKVSGRLATVQVCSLACVFGWFAARAQGQAAGAPEVLGSPPSVCGDFKTLTEERKVGRAQAGEFLAHSLPWGGARVNDFVNALGQTLARASGANQAFTFRILYSPQVNARAFAGGFVFINSGVIGAAKSEAELASVLAHEIAHLNACHWRPLVAPPDSFRSRKAVPVSFIARAAKLAIGEAVSPPSPEAVSRLSQSLERQADRMAVGYLTQAGYDPRAMIRMLDRLETAQARSSLEAPGLSSTHPSAPERRQGLEGFIQCLPKTEAWRRDPSEFMAVREEVRRYDELYIRTLGGPLPWVEDLPPKLSRRPEEKRP